MDPPPSSSHNMRTDAYLHVGIPSEPPQLASDATQAVERGYKPHHSPPNLSPSCITRTDMPHTMSSPLGQISTRSMRSTPPPSPAVCAIPPSLSTARLDVYNMFRHVFTCRKAFWSSPAPSRYNPDVRAAFTGRKYFWSPPASFGYDTNMVFRHATHLPMHPFRPIGSSIIDVLITSPPTNCDCGHTFMCPQLIPPID